MKILLSWFDSNGLDHVEFECTGDIDFEACDYKLWELVQDDKIVTICKVADEK